MHVFLSYRAALQSCADLKESVGIFYREGCTHSRGKSRPQSGSQRLGYISNVMAHCPLTTPRACRQTLPSSSSSPHNYCICSRRFVGRNRSRHRSVTEWSWWAEHHQSTGCLLLEVQTLKRGCQFGSASLLSLHHFTGCFGGEGQSAQPRQARRGEAWQRNCKKRPGH